jgi:hypothetical protein
MDSSANSGLNETVVTLTTLLLENMNSPSYNLTQSEIEWINTFIKSCPDTFNNILDDIKIILSDGKINAHDIPQIIKLITDVYKSNALSVKSYNAKNIILLVKTTLVVILNSSLLPLSDVEKHIMLEVVDSSISLLSMNLDKMEDLIEETLCCDIMKMFHFGK